MNLRKRIEPYSLSEIFLPLIFFTDEKIFWAILLISFSSGLTWVVFDLLKSQPRSAQNAFQLFWFASLGGLGWIFAQIPPYWIWSVYLLVAPAFLLTAEPRSVRPFLFNFKKYGGVRIRELLLGCLFSCAFAGMVLFFHAHYHGIQAWIFSVGILIFWEILSNRIRGLKK